MRLFVAFQFSPPIKDELAEIVRKIQRYAVQGRFTRRENFHLTVVFIGETSDVDAVKRALDRVEAEKFTLQINGLGKFRREGGDILWLGIDKNPALTNIHRQVYDNLVREGFKLEKRAFKPHLTLGRQVILVRDFKPEEFWQELRPLSQEMRKISLMKSERINGQLIYTEIYAKELQ